MRLPDGEYSVMSFMTVDHAADESATVLVGARPRARRRRRGGPRRPRAAKPSPVDVDDDGVVRGSAASTCGPTHSARSIDSVTSDGFYAQPMTGRMPTRSRSRAAGDWSSDAATEGGKGAARPHQLHRIASCTTPPSSRARRRRRRQRARVRIGEGARQVAVATARAEVSASAARATRPAAGAVGPARRELTPTGVFNDVGGQQDYATEVDLPSHRSAGSGRDTCVVDRVEEGHDHRRERDRARGGVRHPPIQRSARSPRTSTTTRRTSRARHDVPRADRRAHRRFRWDFDPATQYSVGAMLRTERGIARTDWVNTDRVEWNQGAC
jgi:hypothetical protein